MTFASLTLPVGQVRRQTLNRQSDSGSRSRVARTGVQAEPAVKFLNTKGKH